MAVPKKQRSKNKKSLRKIFFYKLKNILIYKNSTFKNTNNLKIKTLNYF